MSFLSPNQQHQSTEGKSTVVVTSDALALLIYIAAVPLCCTELQSNADITQISTVVVLLIAVSQALIFGDI